jgi:hypothetical protein
MKIKYTGKSKFISKSLEYEVKRIVENHVLIQADNYKEIWIKPTDYIITVPMNKKIIINKRKEKNLNPPEDI